MTELLYTPFIIIMGIAFILPILLLLMLIRRQIQQRLQSELHYEKIQQALTTQVHQLHVDLQNISQIGQHSIFEKITQGQLTSQQLMTDTMQRQMADVREQMSHSFKQHSSSLTAHLHTLTEEIRTH